MLLPPRSDATRLVAVEPLDRPTLNVLLVDDERTLREGCASALRADGYNVTVAAASAEALDLLQRRTFDIVLLDWYMNEVPGVELLRAALARQPETIVVVMTGRPSIASSLEALQAGAWDYLPKPFSGTQLQILVGRAAHTVMVARETRARQQELQARGGHSDRVSVLGVSPQLREVIELARTVAATDASVFITGESGTGKELIAQFIHYHSRRASRSFVPLNCAALPEPLLESEMFGHVKGAFTGAIRDKPGLLETANGGTIFLDELTEMSKPIQAKLLRAIQDGVVRRVGSELTDAVVNVRYLAATNRDPDDIVKTGALREDLYYRLRVVPIHVPPLRERPDDIPLLANHFLTQYWRRHRDAGLAVPSFSKEALWALRMHTWPGNVRELQNAIEHTVVLVQPGAVIKPVDIPFIVDRITDQDLTELTDADTLDDSYYAVRDRLLARFDKQYLMRVIVRAGGNLSKAARLAKVDRTTFYRLMERRRLMERSLEDGEVTGDAVPGDLE